MFADDIGSRRRFLKTASSGFGMVALSDLLARANAPGSSPPTRAKHVILCYMSGGVSHVDTFDPKPRLSKDHGKSMPIPVERTQFNNNGTIFGSPFSFRQYGDSGLSVSEIFPEIGACADHLAVLRSVTTSVNEHAQGNFAAHTGFPFLGHPSAGAWISYGLGAANENLPSYVVLQSGGAVPPHGGVGLFSSGFLPAQHQASVLRADATPAVRNIRPADPDTNQRSKLNFVRKLDRGFSRSSGETAALEAAIRNYETAYRMQAEIPELCDISGESKATLDAYGVTSQEPKQAAYARQALLARRLVEKGVRFVELSCITHGIGAGGAANPWDQHGQLENGHRTQAYQVDQPIAAMIKDLNERGLLQETLIVFTGEFGRTPFSQGSNGRDHNPFGFSVWLAGGGIKGGTVYGATDELGYHAVENKCTFYDMWATVLHQLGIDHEALTYRYGGRDFRLTDVHGHVLHDVIS
ncbi:MAG: DUF1501 domain-containing protein [Planctomycetaceae bacterium]|nr:DUF1501 domain-containing protein [Planctomycetaceae bacterium]